MAMYYYECPKCGASLDPGEPCEDCMEKEKKLQEKTGYTWTDET